MACSTTASVPGSSEDVASSSTRMSGAARAARASEMSCFSPAENRLPRSRTSVSRPSGSASNRSRMPMDAMASATSSSVASGRARRTFSYRVPLKRNPSWGTTAMVRRSDDSVASRRSTPPMDTEPSTGS